MRFETGQGKGAKIGQFGRVKGALDIGHQRDKSVMVSLSHLRSLQCLVKCPGDEVVADELVEMVCCVPLSALWRCRSFFASGNATATRRYHLAARHRARQ